MESDTKTLQENLSATRGRIEELKVEQRNLQKQFSDLEASTRSAREGVIITEADGKTINRGKLAFAKMASHKRSFEDIRLRLKKNLAHFTEAFEHHCSWEWELKDILEEGVEVNKRAQDGKLPYPELEWLNMEMKY